MAEISVHLTDELQQFVEGQASGEGYGTPSGYIQSLASRAKQGTQRLESLLIEDPDSGEAIPRDDAEWARIRDEVHNRLAE